MEKRSCKSLTRWLPSLPSPLGLPGYIAAIEEVTSETEIQKWQVLRSPCKLFSQRYLFVFHSSRASTAVNFAFLLLWINVVSKWKKSHLKYFSICKSGNNNIYFTGVLYIPMKGLALSGISSLSLWVAQPSVSSPRVQQLALISFKAGSLKLLYTLQISNL